MMTAAAALPENVDPKLVVDWDYYHDPRLKNDPHSVYAEWVRKGREEGHDLVWTTAHGGHWLILNSEAIIEALQTPDLFSSVHTQIPPRPGAAKLIPEELDPPEHTKYRSLLNRKLGPKMIKMFDARSRQMANELLDKVEADGACDLMAALTIPLPCALFLDLVGLPSRRTFEFVDIKNQLFKGGSIELKVAAQNRINEIIAGEINDKRATGATEDLLGYLVNEAQIDEKPVSQEDLMAYAFLFFIAGLDTVTSTMTNCFHYIAKNPGTQEQLVADPSQIPDFIEEILRRYSIVNSVRTATRDFEWRGARIAKGQQFVTGSCFANLDEKQFAEPLKVDWHRENNPHIGFGAGPHRCAGSHLARTELVATLQETLPRLKNLRMRPGVELEFDAGPLVGLTQLPVVWDV